MLNLLIVTLYAIACLGMGALLVKICLPTSAYKVIALEFGIGSTFFGSIWILIGLAGYLNATFISLILIPFLTLGCIRISGVQRSIKFLNIDPLDFKYYTAAIAVSVVMLWYGVLAYYRPPFGDADAFYMTYPKIISHLGALVPMRFVYHDFSTIGLTGEMHYAVLMTLMSPPVTKLFAWVAGIACIFVIMEIVDSVGGKRWAKLLTAAAIVTSTTFTDYLSDGKTDTFSTLIALTCVLLILRIPKAGFHPKTLLLIGILVGTMAFAKFSFIVSMVPTIGLLFVVSALRENRRIGQFCRDMLLVGTGTLLGLFPHLLKNGVLFGNPLAPFLGMEHNWADQGPWFSVSDTLWIVATFPFSLVFGKYPLMGGNLSVIWLAALPFAFFIDWPRRLLESQLFALTASVVVGLLCWFALKPSIFVPRYFIVNLLLLMPIVFVGIEEYLCRRDRSLLILTSFSTLAGAAILSAPFVLPAGVWTATPKRVFQHALNGDPECGLSISEYCAIFKKINKEAEVNTRIFLLGYYSYWLSNPLLMDINTAEENIAFSMQPLNGWEYLTNRGFNLVAVQTATHGHFLEYLRNAPVPEHLSVIEEFPNSNMPIFYIRSKG